MIRLAYGSTLLSIMSSFCVLMWFDECIHVVQILGFKTAFMRELPNGDIVVTRGLHINYFLMCRTVRPGKKW